KPVPRGPALALGGQHLDDVPGAQLVGEWDDLAVDLRADAAVADVGVDLVCEVEWRGARRKRLDLALRGEHEYLVLEQVDLQRLHELARVGLVLLPVQQRAQPLELAVAVLRRRGSAIPAAGGLL